MNQTLGEFIRESREALDLSLREFAAKLKLSPAFMSDIEWGRRFPSEKVLQEIAKELGKPLEELQKLDTRAPVEDIKRLANMNPTFGMAFRTIVDNDISPEELLKWAQKKGKEGDQKKK